MSKGLNQLRYKYKYSFTNIYVLICFTHTVFIKFSFFTNFYSIF